MTDLQPTANIDDEVDGLFEQLPVSVRRERDEVKARRRNLEVEGLENVDQTNSLVEKLRAQHRSTTLQEELTQEKISKYLKGYPHTSSEMERVHLPRLVSPNSEKPEKSKGANGSNKENVKLPPIKKLSGGRNSRGITTSTCAQNMADKFPKGMEGDIPIDSTAEENIRELERRNKILEEQLFGAYDRIISVIKENDTVVMDKVDPKVFGTPGFGPGSEKQRPSFSKESMMVQDGNSKGQQLKEAEKQAERTEVEDLLAETEELIEIEDFLKKYPFERISNDDALVNYEIDEDDLDDMNLDMLDADQLHEIAAHRAAKKGLKPLTEAQEEIENFYKKLEVKQSKKSEVRTPAQPRIPKAVTQMTTASKMKRIPALSKFNSDRPKVPSTISATQSHEKLWKKIKSENKPAERQWSRTSSTNTGPNTTGTKAEKQNSRSSLPDHLRKRSIGQAASLPAAHSDSKSSFQNASTGNPKRPAEIRSKDKLLDELRPPFSLDSDEELSYEDFLKLEIDFLDGDADWKDFEKSPQHEGPGKSYGKDIKNPDAFRQIQERKAKKGTTATLPYRANGRAFQSSNKGAPGVAAKETGATTFNVSRSFKPDRFTNVGHKNSSFTEDGSSRKQR